MFKSDCFSKIERIYCRESLQYSPIKERQFSKTARFKRRPLKMEKSYIFDFQEDTLRDLQDQPGFLSPFKVIFVQNILPNFRRSGMFLLSRSDQQSLSFSRNLPRSSTVMILLILAKHGTLFIGYESLLKNLTLAIRHYLSAYTRVSNFYLEIYPAYSRVFTLKKKHNRWILFFSSFFIYLAKWRLGRILCVYMYVFCAYVWCMFKLAHARVLCVIRIRVWSTYVLFAFA